MLWVLLWSDCLFELEWLIIFILIFYVYDSKFCIIYTVPFIYRIWVLIIYPSHPFKVSFFLSKENGLVEPSLSTIIFSVIFLGFFIAHEYDHSFRLLLPLTILYQAFVFSTYIVRRNRCPPSFPMWWWNMPRRQLGWSAASDEWPGNSCDKREGWVKCQGNNW